MNGNGTMRRVVVAVTLLFCSLHTEAARRRAVSPGRSPITASPSGLIAFVSERDGNSEIYVMNVDGTGLLRLTDHRGPDLDPAWSPDGKRIAFASDRSSTPPLGSQIYVMDADGSNLVRLTESGSNSAPAWSPDGNKIAFSRGVPLGTRIHVMNLDGDWANPTPVGYDRGWNTHSAWSRDSKRIAFVSDRRAFDFLYDIYVMDADGSQITTLFEGPFFTAEGHQFYFHPSWSPDGEKIAVVACAFTVDNCSIATANADGSGLKNLVQTAGIAAVTWSPDGSAIAFSSKACFPCLEELRYVSADGSKSGVIFFDGHDPAWRP